MKKADIIHMVPKRRTRVYSDALRVNLRETAIDELVIDPKYHVLREVVEDYQGLLKKVSDLLYELNHPFRNWAVILPRLRSFALKNPSIYMRHPKGPQAVSLIIDIFLEAIEQAPTPQLRLAAAENLAAYLEKITRNFLGKGIGRLPEVLKGCFERLEALDGERFFFLVRGYHHLKRIGSHLLKNGMQQDVLASFCRLATRSLKHAYRYWMEKEEDPTEWMRREFDKVSVHKELDELIRPISHESLRGLLDQVSSISGFSSPEESLKALLCLPGYMDLVKYYKELPEKLEKLGDIIPPRDSMASRLSTNGKILFLFKIMETEGLVDIHEETLREINRSLIGLIKEEPPERIEEFILRTFWLLKDNVIHYPRTALQCIHAIGVEIFNRRNLRLVEIFLEQVVQFGFQFPEVKGVDENWQVVYNPAHLMNIKVWLELISLNPKWCTTLLSALIINLKLGGTCIKDTDLFQKDISRLLDSDIEPVYNLIKQLTKLLPVFFNEIGAEGLLRDVSTEIDEISHRNDILIHFLRKQSHVESSNLIVDFIEEIFRFWYTRDKSGLVRFLPPEVFKNVAPTGPYVDEVHQVIRAIFGHLGTEDPKRLLQWPQEEAVDFIRGLKGISENEKERVILLVKMYRLEEEKYNLEFRDIRHQFPHLRSQDFPGLELLEGVLKKGDIKTSLGAILDYLETLKEFILSPEHYEVTEDIYHKRHIAADIPSMYGRYREKKFDALGLTFRLENLANLYFEKLVDSINLSLITQSTFFEIVDSIKLFFKAMQLDGISSQRLETSLRLLEDSLRVRGFSSSQYLDIMKGFSEGVKDILYVYYTSIHKDNLAIILRQIEPAHLLPKFLGHHEKDVEPTEMVHRISERFFRDLIANTFGLQYLDNFIAKVYQTLAAQKASLSKEDLDLLMTYDPQKVICDIHDPNPLTTDLIHLGNKGYNIMLLASEGLPIPPGFIITTEMFRCQHIIRGLEQASEDFKARLREGVERIEKATGKRFGDPDNPLLFSVRSGAAISMPGMMDTILNVGINERIVEGMARNSSEPWYAWDNYRRFLQSWGMSFGLERDIFTEIMKSWKARHGVGKKREFSGEQMKRMSLEYRRALEERGILVEDDPWEQLWMAIHQVLYSWSSPKSAKFRDIMGISNEWGTAVIVQAMVFGNLSLSAGSGVLFTANPQKKMRRVVLWGDFTPGNQGEDIVGGLVTTYPISIEQKVLAGRKGEISLEESFPEIYRRLLAISEDLIYKKGWNPQEIEFSFEGPETDKLYILQTRDMVTKKKGEAAVFRPTEKLQRSYLGKGIGVSGGALWGRAVFSRRDIERLRRMDSDSPMILIRSDTVPDDIREISEAEGLLTAKGGQTSHAAIIAVRLEKSCVVGCNNLVVWDGESRCSISDKEIRFGDYISINGNDGSIYLGKHEVQKGAKLDFWLL